MLQQGNKNEAIAKVRHAAEIDATQTQDQLNTLGYQLLGKKKIKDAIEIFKLNVEAFPEASNPYDSIGKAYMENGDIELALKNYEKSLELNPDNSNAVEMIEKLKLMATK